MFGLIIGLLVGAGVERRARDAGRIRALNRKEDKKRKRSVWIGLGVGVVALVIGAVYFLVR